MSNPHFGSEQSNNQQPGQHPQGYQPQQPGYQPPQGYQPEQNFQAEQAGENSVANNQNSQPSPFSVLLPTLKAIKEGDYDAAEKEISRSAHAWLIPIFAMAILFSLVWSIFQTLFVSSLFSDSGLRFIVGPDYSSSRAFFTTLFFMLLCYTSVAFLRVLFIMGTARIREVNMSYVDAGRIFALSEAPAVLLIAVGVPIFLIAGATAASMPTLLALIVIAMAVYVREALIILRLRARTERELLIPSTWMLGGFMVSASLVTFIFAKIFY